VQQVDRVIHSGGKSEDRSPNSLLNVDEKLRFRIAKTSADAEHRVPVIRLFDMLNGEEKINR